MPKKALRWSFPDKVPRKTPVETLEIGEEHPSNRHQRTKEGRGTFIRDFLGFCALNWLQNRPILIRFGGEEWLRSFLPFPARHASKTPAGPNHSRPAQAQKKIRLLHFQPASRLLDSLPLYYPNYESPDFPWELLLTKEWGVSFFCDLTRFWRPVRLSS